MREHIAFLVFAPYGDSSSQVNEDKNKKLMIELEGGYYNNPRYFGPGISHSVRLDRLISLVRDKNGEDVLNTHTFWYTNTLKDNYEKSGIIPWEDVCQCIYHPSKSNSEEKVEMSDEDFYEMWRNEIAMETGMLYGIDAYNDIRGC